MSKYSLCATTDFYQLPKTDSVGRYQEIRRLLDNLNQLRLDEVLETLKKFDKKNLDANSNFSPTSLLVNDYEKDERLESLLFQCVTAIPTGTTADWKDFDQKQSGIFDLLAPMFTNTTMCKALLLSATQNTNMVKHIVTKYKNISLTFTSDQSESVLHLCCISGTERPFKAVLSALMGATLSKPELVDLLLQKDVRGRTALQYACAHGNLDMVNSVHDLCGKAELPFSKLLREKDSEGHTCLTLAIMSPSLKLTKFLLKNGADVGLGGIFALSSPLHIACWFANRIEQLERREIVKELLKRGAQINPSDSSGSAVHIASYGHGGQTDGEVIKWLIESNGGKEALNNRDKDGLLPIHIAAKYGTVEQMRVILDTDQYLLLETTNDGLTPLHISFCRPILDVKMVELMLEFATDPNDPLLLRKLVEVKSHKTCQTALHLAAKSGNLQLFRALLHTGCDYRAKDFEGETPLLIAVTSGFEQAVMDLVELDRFALEDVNNRQESWLHKAILNGQTQLLEEFKSSTSPYELMRCGKYHDDMLSPIELAASQGECEILRILLEILKVADLRYDLQRYGDSYAGLQGKALKAAALSKNGVEVAKILLRDKKSIEQKIEGKNGLDWALESDNFPVVKVILESEYWQVAMRNSYCSEDFPAMTPMRQLVAKSTDLAKLLLDRCMTVEQFRDRKDKKTIRKNPAVATFNYEFIDDTFAINEWQKDTSSWTPYSTNGYTVKNNHVISHMVDCERVELLNHPVVKSLVYHRWRKYGKIFMALLLLFYSTFLCFLNGYAWYSPVPYQNGTTAEVTNSTTNFHESNFVSFARYGICVQAVLYIIKELVELGLKKLKYFGQLDNWVEMFLYPLAMVFALKGNLDSDTHWIIGCVALFLGWINFLLLLRKIRQVGVQVLMFTRVATTFAKFLLVFLLFALAFGFPFYLLVRNHSGFKSLGLSMVKVGVMAVGENTLFDQSVKTSLEEELVAVYYPYATIVFLVLFLFLVTTVLKNMLEGLAVGDIQRELAHSKLRKLQLQTDFVLDIESVLISNWKWSKSLVKRMDFFVRSKTVRLYDRFDCRSLKSTCCRHSEPPLFPEIPFSTAKEIARDHEKELLTLKH